MQDILACAMGLDVHRDVIVACLEKGAIGADSKIEIRSFSTLNKLRLLRDMQNQYLGRSLIFA